MATFDEIMAAAVNADKAGDTQAAQMLVDLARQSQGQAAPVTGSANPPENDPMVPFAEAPAHRKRQAPNSKTGLGTQSNQQPQPHMRLQKLTARAC